MGAIIDLWKSERGLIMVALTAVATVLCGLGTISVDQWLTYTKWLFVTYVAGKTVTGSVALASASTPTDRAAKSENIDRVLSLVSQLFPGTAPAPDPVPDPTVNHGPASATAPIPPTVSTAPAGPPSSTQGA